MEDTEINNEPVEIWGGAEYSLVRVREKIYDQLAVSGQEKWLQDYRLFTDSGIKTIRYPLLWEKFAAGEKEFFRINDERLGKLRELGITPIAGLLHHGSGPFNTSLYERDFPELLSEFAFRIASRYPWIESYTPVNEPLTTARFSGLYGIWYPHFTDGYSFLRIFLNELKGIILSMRAAAAINPGARLVQTEDLCRVLSIPGLRYQADFENERRWLTYDILTGLLVPGHPMYQYFISQGIKEDELMFFEENSIRPHICGFNYYVTSERYLDTNKLLYPPLYHGGNGMQEYADVEAVRSNINSDIGSYGLLREAWDRYHLPLALTEVHLACTREEQLRWFYEAYLTGNRLKSEGVDFRAVTAWSFFGAFDWNTLMCEKNNIYEAGVYDIRSGKPRATALVGLIKSLNSGNYSNGELLKVPGWWKRSDRFIYKPENEPSYIVQNDYDNPPDIRPLLVLGAGGSLGMAFAKICRTRGLVTCLSGREHLDIASEESVKKAIEDIRPWAVVNAAGFSGIDEAESAAYTCFRENTIGPAILAEACRSAGIRFLTFSTDQVFNGRKKEPYNVDDSTGPLNLYGMSKKLAEEKIMKIYPDTLIIRSGLFFNPWSVSDRLRHILNSGISGRQQYYLPSDIIFSPAYVPDLVNAALDLLIDNESGIWHLSGQDEISWPEFAISALRLAGLDESIVTPVPAAGLGYPAPRPLYSSLRSSSGITLMPVRHAMQSYMEEFFRESALLVELSNSEIQ